MSHRCSCYSGAASITLSWWEQMARGGSASVEKCVGVCAGEGVVELRVPGKTVGWRRMQTAAQRPSESSRPPTAVVAFSWSGARQPAVVQGQQPKKKKWGRVALWLQECMTCELSRRGGGWSRRSPPGVRAGRGRAAASQWAQWPADTQWVSSHHGCSERLQVNPARVPWEVWTLYTQLQQLYEG